MPSGLQSSPFLIIVIVIIHITIQETSSRSWSWTSPIPGQYIFGVILPTVPFSRVGVVRLKYSREVGLITFSKSSDGSQTKPIAAISPRSTAPRRCYFLEVLGAKQRCPRHHQARHCCAVDPRASHEPSLLSIPHKYRPRQSHPSQSRDHSPK